jgi:hypothetical protein
MYQKTDRSTMHGVGTPHGLGVPHRYPNVTGFSLSDIFSNLVRQLYPTGRVWYQKKGGVFYNLHVSINRTYIRFVEACRLTIDSALPDNDNFDENDCALWEFRLGLVTNTSLSLDVRRQAILRKMAYPSNIKPRQNGLFIESQLRLAGFDVYVHENIRPYRTPADIIAISFNNTQHGGVTQHGDGTQHGSLGFDVIANLAVPNEQYSTGSNLWPTFFIGGETLGELATIDENRLIEFKELILKSKPAHTVVYTFINFT